MCKLRHSYNNLITQINLCNKTISPKNGVFVMGIINTTPDSFFSGSRKTEPQEAAETALRMVQDGADILDLGAESTRPGAMYVSEEEQIRRMLPVLQEIRKKTDCPVSIDTRSLKVFQTMFDNGADIINDISAFEDDAGLADFAAKEKIPVILMHKKGNPDEMMSNLCYNDIVTDIISYFKERISFAHSKGLQDDRIILDPGIGFSKNLSQNIEIISRAFDFSFNGTYPVLIGASRKTCIGQLTGKTAENRLAGTLAVHQLAVLYGASILRVHDVPETVDMLKVLKGFGK